VTWDAKAVHDSLVQQGYAEHLQVMQRHVLCEGNPVVGLVQEVNRLRAAASQEAKPVAADWQHVANEWADVATSALQWLRNVVDGTTHGEAAITNTENCIEQCLRLQTKVRTTTSQPFTYYKEPHQGWPEYSKQNEFSDGSGGGLPLYAAPQEQAPADKDALRWKELERQHGTLSEPRAEPMRFAVCEYSEARGHWFYLQTPLAATIDGLLQSQPQQVTK